MRHFNKTRKDKYSRAVYFLKYFLILIAVGLVLPIPLAVKRPEIFSSLNNFTDYFLTQYDAPWVNEVKYSAAFKNGSVLQLKAVSGQRDPDDQLVLLDVHADILTNKNDLIVITSNLGYFDELQNIIRLEGNVQILATNQSQISTDKLILSINENKITSNVETTLKTLSGTIVGGHFRYDIQPQNQSQSNLIFSNGVHSMFASTGQSD